MLPAFRRKSRTHAHTHTCTGSEAHTCAEGWLWKHLYFCVYSPSKQMRKQFKWRQARRGKGNGEREKLFRNGNGNCTLHIQQGIFHGICFNWLIDVLIGKSNCCAEFCRDIFAPPFLAPFSFFSLLFWDSQVFFSFLVFVFRDAASG